LSVVDLPVVRVSNAVAHFAASLPFRVRCSDDLRVDGLAWAKRNDALRRREIAPDPPGWKTALRFDVDCPCDRGGGASHTRPHPKSGYCPRAATYWRDAGVAQPSFIILNPRNGHAHFIYLLRGWLRIDGAAAEDLPALRYYAAIERAYTRALRADASYAGLVQHNPFHAAYETLSGRDEPYSLAELAAFIELPRVAYRRAVEIRTDGRNVETFDRLRFWTYAQISEYRCGDRQTWEDVVAAQAVAIAAEVRQAHPAAAHPFTDAEALDTAKSVAGWVWLRYVGGHLTRVRADTAAQRETDRKRAAAARRTRGAITRDDYLAEAQRRRTAASTLRGLGVSIIEIAHRLGASVRSVHRWISEIRCVPGPSAPSDFEPPSRPKPPSVVLDANPNLVVKDGNETPGRAPVGAADGKDGVGARSAQPETPLAYIRRRIAEIVGKRGDNPRPP
jgi:hypothetical protein